MRPRSGQRGLHAYAAGGVRPGGATPSSSQPQLDGGRAVRSEVKRDFSGREVGPRSPLIGNPQSAPARPTFIVRRAPVLDAAAPDLEGRRAEVVVNRPGFGRQHGAEAWRRWFGSASPKEPTGAAMGPVAKLRLSLLGLSGQQRARSPRQRHRRPSPAAHGSVGKPAGCRRDRGDRGRQPNGAPRPVPTRSPDG